MIPLSKFLAVLEHTFFAMHRQSTQSLWPTVVFVRIVILQIGWRSGSMSKYELYHHQFAFSFELLILCFSTTNQRDHGKDTDADQAAEHEQNKNPFASARLVEVGHSARHDFDDEISALDGFDRH